MLLFNSFVAEHMKQVTIVLLLSTIVYSAMLVHYVGGGTNISGILHSWMEWNICIHIRKAKSRVAGTVLDNNQG